MLYHYAPLRFLEKIIAARRLRPSDDMNGKLLWATSAETIPDPTSYAAHEPHIVRFTLHTDDFERWTDVRARFRKDKRERAEDMEKCGRLKYGIDPKNWYVRRGALPSSRWLRIDVRDQRWHPYQSDVWRQPGLRPQLAALPWIYRDWYMKHGIDLGDDPRTMDDDALADWTIYQRKDEDEPEEEDLES